MPFEVMVIVIVAIVAGTVSGIVKQALNYQKEMRQAAKGSKGDVTTSELAKLMREATEEATAPLLARIDALEERLERAGQLPPSDTPLLLDDADTVDESVEPTRRRVR